MSSSFARRWRASSLRSGNTFVGLQALLVEASEDGRALHPSWEPLRGRIVLAWRDGPPLCSVVRLLEQMTGVAATTGAGRYDDVGVPLLETELAPFTFERTLGPKMMLLALLRAAGIAGDRPPAVLLEQIAGEAFALGAGAHGHVALENAVAKSLLPLTRYLEDFREPERLTPGDEVALGIFGHTAPGPASGVLEVLDCVTSLLSMGPQRELAQVVDELVRPL